LLDRRYGKLSGGQRRRSEIGRALMGDPRILFLDEPTTGLDPQTRIHVWQTIRKLQSELRMTVFLTTHYMEEAETADWVAVIDGGKIVAEGTPTVLKERHSTDMLRLAPGNGQREELEQWLGAAGRKCERVADRLYVPVQDSLDALGLLRSLEGRYTGFEVVNGSMDDVFVNITGHRIREDG
jgi:multidrug/hemolysin transport system ATP-binding protein